MAHLLFVILSLLSYLAMYIFYGMQARQAGYWIFLFTLLATYILGGVARG